MAIMTTVEYMLAHGQISTIGIKSLNGNDRKKYYMTFIVKVAISILFHPSRTIRNVSKK